MTITRETPYGAFNFLVSIDGIGDPGEPVAGFSEVAGLGVEIDVVEYRNGNDVRTAPRKLPGLHRPRNVTLKRGLVGDLAVFNWMRDVLRGDAAARRTVTITMLDEGRAASVISFRLINAWPCAWNGPTLSGKGGEVAMESVELCCEALDIE